MYSKKSSKISTNTVSSVDLFKNKPMNNPRACHGGGFMLRARSDPGRLSCKSHVRNGKTDATGNKTVNHWGPEVKLLTFYHGEHLIFQ